MLLRSMALTGLVTVIWWIVDGVGISNVGYAAGLLLGEIARQNDIRRHSRRVARAIVAAREITPSDLAPLVGRAEVQVMVELDPTEAEQASEVVDPNPVMREEQITRETGSGAGTAAAPAGVPGAAANQPPEAGGLAPEPAAPVASAAWMIRRWECPPSRVRW